MIEKVNMNISNLSMINEREITYEGVKVVGPKGETDVAISGDEIEKTQTDSFIQGVLKGIGTTILGAGYPLVTSIYKSVEGYRKVQEAAQEVGLDDRESKITGLKGALLGGLKGFVHGFVDLIAIRALTLVGGALGGPLGASLATIIGGGLFNLAKDTIRSKYDILRD